MAKPTMKDVARIAGVSLATVSRAIKEPHKVKEETRRHIHEAMESLAYVYNASAGDLSRKKSTVVGVLLPAAQRNMAFGDTIQAIQDEALKVGYSIMTGDTGQNNATENDLIQLFEQRNIGGLIMAGYSPSNEKLVRSLARTGTTCVVVWEYGHDSEISYVGIDNFAAMRELTEYMISLGHRRIGMISGMYTKSERPYRRLLGYRAALENSGLSFDPDIVVEGLPLMAVGKSAMEQIMKRKNPPSAVLASNDMAAVGALAAARELGLDVPGDVSLAGFDNIALAEFTSPPLTSVSIPAYEMGKRAFELILRSQRGDVVPDKLSESILLEHKIVERESCRRIL